MTRITPQKHSIRPWPSLSLGSAAGYLGYPQPTFIGDLWRSLVPEYRSRSYGPAIFSVHWDLEIALAVLDLSAKRATNRVNNYLLPEEVHRVKSKLSGKSEASIRFGRLKTGHGYSGERGDFCVTSGVIKGRNLTLYYRSLEMMGGFAYDLCLIAKLGNLLDIDWNVITFITAKAFTFALKGNSNEKLYPKLSRIFARSTAG